MADSGRSESWAVLMKDERIRYRSAERTAVITHNVRAFCLTSGNLRAAAMGHQYLAILHDLAEACRQPGPFIYAVSSTGPRRVDLTP